MTENYEFVDILGIEADQLPDFASMTRRSAAGPDAVKENLQPINKCLESRGLTPVLLELAVIHDGRLTEHARRAPFAGIRTDRAGVALDTYFVSDIATYLDDSNVAGIVYGAWDQAIERLLEAAEGKPGAIVPNPAVYAKPVINCPLRPLIEANEEPNGEFQQWARAYASEERTRETWDGAKRKSYEFKWFDTNADPKDSVGRIAGNFIRYLRSMEGLRSDHAEAAKPFANLWTTLLETQLWVIPFLRPSLTGKAGASIPTPRRDMSSFGGCLFAFVVPSSKVLLSLRDAVTSVSLILARAAVAEAYSGIALRDNERHTAAVLGHHLPSNLRTLETALGDTRDGLSDARVTEPLIIRTLEKGRMLAQWLQRTTKYLIEGIKGHTREFSAILTAEEFIAEVDLLLREEWNDQIRSLEREDLTCVAPPSVKSQEQVLRDMNVHTIKTDREYLRFMINQLIANAVCHGDYEHENIVTASIALDQTDFSAVTLTIQNPASPGDLAKLSQAEDNDWQGRIGLDAMRITAHLWRTQRPEFRPNGTHITAVIQAATALGRGTKETAK